MRSCPGSLCRDGPAQGMCRRRRRHSTSAATAQPETASLCRLPPAPVSSLQVSSHTSTPGCLLSSRMYNALSSSSRRHAVFARGQFPKDIRQRRSFVRRALTFLRRALTVLHTHVCRPDRDAEHASRQQAAGRGRCRPSVAWHAHPRRRVPLCLARRRPPHLSGAQPRMTCYWAAEWNHGIEENLHCSATEAVLRINLGVGSNSAHTVQHASPAARLFLYPVGSSHYSKPLTCGSRSCSGRPPSFPRWPQPPQR